MWEKRGEGHGWLCEAPSRWMDSTHSPKWDFPFCSANLFKTQRHTDLLANLTGNIRLQPPSEDLVNNAVTVVWIVGLLPIIFSCVAQKAGSINTHTDNTNSLSGTSEGLWSSPLSHFTVPCSKASLPLYNPLDSLQLIEASHTAGSVVGSSLHCSRAYWHSSHRLLPVLLVHTIVSLLQYVFSTVRHWALWIDCKYDSTLPDQRHEVAQSSQLTLLLVVFPHSDQLE